MNKLTNILALDLGTKTWMAVYEPPGIVTDTVSFQPRKGELEGSRFHKFYHYLSVRKCLFNFEKVYYEEVRRHAGVQAAHMYGGFRAVLLMWCVENNIPCIGVGVTTIKKFGTGKGNATKEMMIKSAEELGYRPVDDNAADALHLLRYALEQERK